MRHYRLPTSVERKFLRIVTRDYPELASQVESCEIADYDSTGWCYLRPLGGLPSPIRYHAEGPDVRTATAEAPLIGTIIWTDRLGMLESIEILAYGGREAHGEQAPYGLFVDAAEKEPSLLRYPERS